MALPLLGLLTPLIDKALSFIPDPAEKERARRELHKQFLEQEDSFRDFIVSYEGAAKDVGPFLQNLRGSVRPVITYAGLGVFVWAIWSNQPNTILDMLFKLNLLTLGFWFSTRALEKLGLDLKGAFKK